MSDAGDRFAEKAPGVVRAASGREGEYIHEYRGSIESVEESVRLLTLAPQISDEAVHDAFARVAGQWHNPSTHPNVVTVHDRGTTPQPWLAVADTDGQPLATLQSHLSVPEVRTIIADVAEALRNANLYNTTHLALRPEDIWVVNTDDGRQALVDGWGLERACRVAAGERPLSPFTAPELVDDPDCGTEETDVYGLGAVAYFALTGQPPITGKDDLETAIIDGGVTRPSEYTDVSAGVDDVILTALAARPANRQPSTYAFRTAIRNELPTGAPKTPTPKTEAEAKDIEGTTSTTDKPEGPDDETDTQDGLLVSRRGLLGFGVLGFGGIGGVGYHLTATGPENSTSTLPNPDAKSPSAQTPTTTTETTEEPSTETEEQQGSLSPLANEATVEMTPEDGRFVFSPQVVSIRRGGTVTWKSKTGVHTVTAYHPDTGKPRHMPKDAKSFDSGLIEEGATFSHTFDTPGVYLYYCRPHESNGMVGAVVIGDPDPSKEAGMRDPADSLPSAAKEELSMLQDDISTQRELPMVADVSMRTTDTDYVFTPALVNVRRGGTIRWQSQSGVHSATAYHPGNGEPRRVPNGAKAWSSDLLSEGVTFSVNLQRPGVYDYFCMPHEGNGMVGSIIVGIPEDLDSEPGLAEVREERPEAAAERLSDLNERATQHIESGTLTGNGTTTKNDNNTETETNTGGSDLPPPNLDGYLSNTSNYDGEPVDKTGQDTVTIDVGASGNVDNFAFGPAAVYIDSGTTVECTWTGDGGQHNVVDEDGAFESALQSSGTFSKIVDSTGPIKYYCSPHKALGMRGVLIVE